MKYLIWFVFAPALSGCAWWSGPDWSGGSSPAIENPEYVAPAAFSPGEPLRARVATGRPSAIVPCVTGASISELCRRDAEAHLYAGPAEIRQ